MVVEEARGRSVLKEIFVMFTLRGRSMLVVAVLLGKPVVGSLPHGSMAWGM